MAEAEENWQTGKVPQVKNPQVGCKTQLILLILFCICISRLHTDQKYSKVICYQPLVFISGVDTLKHSQNLDQVLSQVPQLAIDQLTYSDGEDISSDDTES